MKIVIAAALALAAAPAAAAPATRITSGSGQRSVQLGAYQPLGQTFTATGTTLSAFGFELMGYGNSGPNAAVTLTIRSGDGTTGAALATQTLTPTGLSTSYGSLGWLDFSFNAALTPGQTYSAVLTTSSVLFGLVYGPDINIYTGAAQGGDAYAGGHFFSTQTPDAVCKTGICDANFEYTITGAATTAVPEPASWALAMGGLGVAGGALRRRRRAVATLAAA